MKNKFKAILIIILFIPACSGFGEKRSDKSDEFLIEKKNPLVMPPDINDLPEPNQEKIGSNNNNFENKLKSKKINSQSLKTNSSNTLQESIIKKIEQ